MGCDIHAFMEVKLPGSENWECYSTLDITRDYRLFSLMAGVRNYDPYTVEPIAIPRGIPDDVSSIVKFHIQDWGEDGHTHSWLTALEMKTLMEMLYEGDGFTFARDFGWVFGCYPWSEQNEDKLIRLVFFFDN